jgi:hypothetical protein
VYCRLGNSLRLLLYVTQKLSLMVESLDPLSQVAKMVVRILVSCRLGAKSLKTKSYNMQPAMRLNRWAPIISRLSKDVVEKKTEY